MGSLDPALAAFFDFFKLGMLLVATYQFNVNSGAVCCCFQQAWEAHLLFLAQAALRAVSATSVAW